VSKRMSEQGKRLQSECDQSRNIYHHFMREYELAKTAKSVARRAYLRDVIKLDEHNKAG